MSWGNYARRCTLEKPGDSPRVSSNTPWASDGVSPSGSPTNCPTTLELYPVGHSNGGETAPDGLAPSGAHGSKLESLSCHPLLPDNPTGAFKTPTGLAPSGESGSQATHPLRRWRNPGTVPEFSSYTPWASDGTSPSGSRSGQRRLVAIRAFLGAQAACRQNDSRLGRLILMPSSSRRRGRANRTVAVDG